MAAWSSSIRRPVKTRPVAVSGRLYVNGTSMSNVVPEKGGKSKLAFDVVRMYSVTHQFDYYAAFVDIKTKVLTLFRLQIQKHDFQVDINKTTKASDQPDGSLCTCGLVRSNSI